MKAVLLFVLSACLSTAALAQTSASVTVSNLRYTLVDLDLGDGISPSLSFLLRPGAQRSSTTVTSYAAADGVPIADQDWGAAPFASVESSIVRAFGQGSGSVLALPDWQVRLDSSASVAPGRGSSNVIGSNVLSGQLGFVLSPMTAVTFYADISAEGRALAAALPSDRSLAWLHAGMAIYPVPFEDGAPWWTSWDRDVEAGHTFSTTTLMEVGVSNTIAWQEDYHLTVNSAVQASSQALAVPEPASWVMLLAGAVLIGFRQSRHAKATGQGLPASR